MSSNDQIAASDNSPTKDDLIEAQREQEAQLKAKYPSVQRPGPQLLQKRMQKGQKYFDSGDYNMAKALNKSGKRTPSTLSQTQSGQGSTGNASGSSGIPAAILETPPPTGDAIPTPNHLSTRKASIHVQSKLVTGEFA